MPAGWSAVRRRHRNRAPGDFARRATGGGSTRELELMPQALDLGAQPRDFIFGLGEGGAQRVVDGGGSVGWRRRNGEPPVGAQERMVGAPSECEELIDLNVGEPG